MICIRCQQDSKYPQRKDDKRCPYCRGEFAFEPREGAKLSDKAFNAAIERVSSDGEVWWGVEHLYFEIARVLSKKSVSKAVSWILAVIAALFGSIILTPFVGIPVAIFFVWLAFRKPNPELKLDRAQFEDMWRRWMKTHGAPRRLIARRELPAQERKLDADIAQYSFDRVVICDQARTVDLLLANNFHFENNCAVLGAGGYPEHAFGTVLAMLRNNPRLDVYVLHDATAAGCELARRVAKDPQWFGGRLPVIDVGLRPAHAMKQRGSWQMRKPAPAASTLPSELTADERAWLAAGWVMELASIRPEQVIKRLYRAIAVERTSTDDGAGAYAGGDIHFFSISDFSSDASASDGGGDSFG